MKPTAQLFKGHFAFYRVLHSVLRFTLYAEFYACLLVSALHLSTESHVVEWAQAMQGQGQPNGPVHWTLSNVHWCPPCCPHCSSPNPPHCPEHCSSPSPTQCPPSLPIFKDAKSFNLGFNFNSTSCQIDAFLHEVWNRIIETPCFYTFDQFMLFVQTF